MPNFPPILRNSKTFLRKITLTCLRVKHYEDQVNWLNDDERMMVRRVASRMLYGKDERQEDMQFVVEKIYQECERNGCSLSGWKLFFVIYHELALHVGLYQQ